MAERHVLYQSAGCPFCHRVRLFLEQEGIGLELCDTVRDPQARRDLLEGGGRGMVPCLRIERDREVHWLYESMDIIEYLRRYHAEAATPVSNYHRGSKP